MPDSVETSPVPVIAQVDALIGRAGAYAAQSTGPGTRRAYRSAWRGYVAWCDSHGRAPLTGDPWQVALYLTQRAEDGLAVASLRVARAAIRAAHRLAGVALDLADPQLAMVMEGIARCNAARPRRRATPAVPDVLRRLLAALPCPTTPAAAAPALAARHRAMLLLGFGAALRRSELAGLRVGDVSIVAGRGLSVLVRRGKTDQHGRGRTLALWANHRDPTFCPLVAFAAWLAFRRGAADWIPDSRPDSHDAAAELPLFCAISSAGRVLGGPALADKVVNRLLKQAARAAGLDPARFSGHSLRRGLLTDAGDRQIPLVDLMRHARHKSVDAALGYIEAGDAWRNNITAGVFRDSPRLDRADARDGELAAG